MSRHSSADDADADTDAPADVLVDSPLADAMRRRREAAAASPVAPRRRRAADAVAEEALGWPAVGQEPDSAMALGWPVMASRSASPAAESGDSPLTAGRPPDAMRSVSPGPALPRSGWRKLVLTVSRGAIDPGESAADAAYRGLAGRVCVPLAGSRRIAVISLKGGVGKTTMSVCLGATLASLRSDRVIAMDANPDRGTLAGKVPPESNATVRDLIERMDEVRSYADMRRFTSQSPDRLEVLASSADPAISDAFDEADYRTVSAVLETYYNLVLTDCGTGLLHSAMRGVLDLVDQLVIVSTNSVDAAGSASATLDWLQMHGRADLVAGGVAVINSVLPGTAAVDIDRLEAHFASRCRAVTRVPHDPHLLTGAEVELSRLRPATRMAVLRLAAEVVDGLAGPSH